MSLRFVLGGSGSGKSTRIYGEILQRAKKEPGRNFLIVVPDQFTMQTQKELVLHPENESHGILNIDVLSFGRLSHRILEEVGKKDIPVLDDTGKSLILRKVAGDLKEDLPYLGAHLQKQGYIHEVKSAISEFMQYGISCKDVDILIKYAEKKGALYHKLKDLQKIYEGFSLYIKDHYITTEETLDVLCGALHKSKIVKGSVVVFDGFTGFTPIQYRVIETLLTLTKEVWVTVTIPAQENPFVPDGEQKLFHLSKKTIADICKLAELNGVSRGEDIVLNYEGVHRFCGNPVLAHLEQSLFRYPLKAFHAKEDESGKKDCDVNNTLHLFAASTIAEEVRQTGIYIEQLVRNEGYAYRDIAVVTGNLEGYSNQINSRFKDLDIPCYVDQNRAILLNPLTEYIKAAMEILEKNFTYESVFKFLRSGLACLSKEETDILENYCLETGIRGKKKWSEQFVFKTKNMLDDIELLWQVDGFRTRLMEELSPLLALSEIREKKAGDYVLALYELLNKNHAAVKLDYYSKMFAEQGDKVREREYAQVYRLIMELLEQIMALLKEEPMTLKEFREIVEAGLTEIQVGSIPQNVDRVLVGDIERTRLKEVKVVFFLGINDGNIPKSGGKGGIISDIDREFLQGSELELAPSPRQKMYIQRLYLYLNMTKPSEKLYLSYAKMDGEGKGMRPAYLIDTIKQLFPDLVTEYPEEKDVLEQIYSAKEGVLFLAGKMREYAESNREVEDIHTLYQAFQVEENTRIILQKLTDAAFYEYAGGGLSRQVAKALYGRMLVNSVSRIETFARCAYRQFLAYGLALKERESFSFERVDLGNIYHAVLEGFADKLAESPYTWFDFPREFAEKTVREVLSLCTADYGATVLYATARNAYNVARMERVLTRAVDTIQYQLKKGSFVPREFEMSFHTVSDLDSVNIALSEEEKMKLVGKIDRVDIAESEDKIFVKIVDYKSGEKNFDLAALYYGQSLQLVVYLNAAMETIKKKNPDKDVVPAAMLYYHVADDCFDAEGELTPEEVSEKIRQSLRTSGVVSADRSVIDRLDKELTEKSDVIPVAIKKKDGNLTANSSVFTEEEMAEISKFVTGKVKECGRAIVEGNVELNPMEEGQRTSCTYCPYKGDCGFDLNQRGFSYRKLPAMEKEEIMERIREENASWQ